MKIYFTASISGKEKYLSNYKMIIEALKNLDVQILSNHVLITDREDIEKVSPEDERKFYDKVNEWINQSDIVIAEVSHQSTSIGHEITHAFSKNKPVILLHVEDKSPILFKGIKSDRLQLIEYHVEDLESQLKKAINFASDNQDTRFNFFISPEHQNYLDWIAKHRKIPRSVFLRRLIEEHMEDNPDYKG